MQRKVLAAAIACLTVPWAAFAQQQSQQAQSSTPPSLQSQNVPPSPVRSTDTPLRIGGNVMQAKLVHAVRPVYPPIAKQAQVSGTVVLHALIAKDGTVKELQVISGPPLLCQAAMDAVKQWQYQPTILNGQPVEIDTTISVVFDLGGTPAPASGAASAEANSESEKPLDPHLKASIMKLLDVIHAAGMAQNGAKIMFQQLRPTLIASLPPTSHREQIVDAYGDKLAALLASQEAMDRIATIYAKYFSGDDINGLITFYQTPVGQRALAVLPQVYAESAQAGSNIARENIPRIFKELCKEYPELQGKVQFCPAATKSESSELRDTEFSTPAASLNPTQF